MQCYTELIAPTAVTHSAALPFLAPNANNLLVAKTSLLQLFSVQPFHDGAKSKLLLIGEYTLAGTVSALASIRALNTKSGGHAVLIAFKDAKLSLVEWDPENHRISTISIHYYEGENLLHPPFGPTLSECESILTVDPSSRCAALKFGARHLAILPFKQLGDDLAEGLEDGDVDMDAVGVTQTPSHPNDNDEAVQTPYKSSFVLPLTVLDPALIHTIHLAFLEEYREPTFGFLSSATQPSTALLADRKDCLNYTVLTLDLDQRASTNLVTVSKLPSDLWKIIPLALPVGGALLVGNNEFVHVDQSGKTTAVAVNEFARQASNFTMVDQSALNMKLEHCEITVLNRRTGDHLIVLDDGSLAVLGFKLLGRNVGGLTVTRVVGDRGGQLLESAPSSLVSLRSGDTIFVGSEDGDSMLLAWRKDGASLSRKRSHVQMLDGDGAEQDSEDIDEVDEDDLYATAPELAKRSASPTAQESVDSARNYSFEQHDVLQSLGPINQVCMGKSSSDDKDKLDLLAATGRGKASRLACMHREIVPSGKRNTPFAGVKNVWSVSARPQDDSPSEAATEDDSDNLLFVFDGESTKVFDVSNPDRESTTHLERTGTEFEEDGETLAVFKLANKQTLVQCRRSEIRTYNADLNLCSIIPMYADDSDAELRIVATSFCDEYILVHRDDSSVQILKIDDHGDAEPLVEGEGAIAEKKWLSGCLSPNLTSEGGPCVYLLGQEGGLHIFSLPSLDLCYHAPSLTQLPPVLSADVPQRRGGGKAALTELLVAALGNEDHAQPYFVVRSSIDDLILYEPFFQHATGEASRTSFADLRFRKVPCHYLPKYDETLDNAEDDRPAALQPICIGGYRAVYIPGASPSMVLKDATSSPKIVSVRASKVKAISASNHAGCKKGFALVDTSGTVSEYTLPVDTWYGTGWAVDRITLGEPAEEIRNVAFHEERGVYVVATCRNVDFLFPEDDGKHQDQDGMYPLLLAARVTVHLPSNRPPTHASRAYTLLPSLHGAPSIVDAISSTLSFLFSRPDLLVWA